MRSILWSIGALALAVLFCSVGGFIGWWFSQNQIDVNPRVDVVITPTPDAAATAIAIVEEARANAGILLSEAQALLNEAETVDSPEEAVSILATAEAILEIVGQMPVSTEVVVAPTPTQSLLRFAVVDDNSVTTTIRQDTVALLESEYPDVEVVGFAACTQELLDQEWSGIVMDLGMDASPMWGDACTSAILAEYPETIVVGYTRGGSNHQKMRNAGAVDSCNKPDPECILSAFGDNLDS